MSQELASKAMLVKLSISRWSARKHDRKVSGEVAKQYGTNQDRGRYNKVLLAKDALAAIQKAESAARTFHYEQTLPWKDDGARILPSANYLNYTSEMRKLKGVFEEAVRAFIDNYPALLEAARVELNGLFNAADYPDAAKIAKKFGFEMEVDPLPTAGDFRVDLQGAEVSRIQSEIEGRLHKAQAVAMADLFTRLHDVVKHMAEKLADKDAIFRDSLVTNVQDLVELLPRLNLTGDARLDSLRRLVSDKLLTYNPQALRENKTARTATARAASDILAAMAGYTNVI